jgi:hypothetical protein
LPKQPGLPCFYLSAIISSLGPGGTLVIAWKDFEQGQPVAGTLGLLSLLPLSMLLSRGLKTLRVVAHNGEVVEISARALGEIADDRAADVSRSVVASLKDAKNADEVIRLLEQNGLFRLLSKSEIPTFASGKFDAWFDGLAPAVLDRYYANQELKTYISTQLRGPGGFHELLTAGTANHWKRWGITAKQLREEFSISIAALNDGGVAKGWKHQTGRDEPATLSGTVHIELKRIILSSRSLEDFRRNIVPWAEKWLNGGVSALPPGCK